MICDRKFDLLVGQSPHDDLPMSYPLTSCRVPQCGFWSVHRESSPVVSTQSLIMVRLELDQVVMRRMKDDDIEMVKALIKVCTQ